MIDARQSLKDAISKAWLEQTKNPDPLDVTVEAVLDWFQVYLQTPEVVAFAAKEAESVPPIWHMTRRGKIEANYGAITWKILAAIAPRHIQ